MGAIYYNKTTGSIFIPLNPENIIDNIMIYVADPPDVDFALYKYVDDVLTLKTQDELDAQLAAQELASTKTQAIEDLLPNWHTIKTYLDNLDIEIAVISNVATARAAMEKISTTIRKLIRIDYLMIKNKVD